MANEQAFKSGPNKECPLTMQLCCFVDGDGKLKPCEDKKCQSFKAVNCTYSVNS